MEKCLSDPERRFCERCIIRTDHDIIDEPIMITRKSKLKYKCRACGKEKWMMPLRPSSEISY